GRAPLGAGTIGPATAFLLCPRRFGRERGNSLALHSCGVFATTCAHHEQRGPAQDVDVHSVEMSTYIPLLLDDIHAAADTCATVPRSPWSRPFALPTPRPPRRRCSQASSLVLPSVTSRTRTSSATAP